MTKKLALTMIVKDEAKCLGRCLTSVKDMVDEIVIVDTGSLDNTKEIAQSFGARVFDFKWTNSFADARNFALSQSSGDWNLVLDADEYIANNCAKDIRQFIENEKAIGRVKLINKFFQDGEEKYDQSHISRLIPSGTFFRGIIHEQVVSSLPRKIIPVELGHDGYAGTDKGNRNFSLLFQALERTPRDPYLLFQLAKQYYVTQQYAQAAPHFEKCYTIVSEYELYRPAMVVLYLYNIIGQGDFARGLAIINNEQVKLANYPDFHFVSGIFYMELVFKDQRYMNLFPLIEREYQKCLQLGDNGPYDGVIGTGSYYALYNLGVYYEVTANLGKAREYYSKAQACGYEKAGARLQALGQ